MDVTVNGERRALAEGTTVSQLLQQLQVAPERVVVEVNLTILKRAQHAMTALHPGDQVEIVQFVGGGSRDCSRLEAVGSRQLPRTSSFEPRTGRRW